jgi:hypothetical protein
MEKNSLVICVHDLFKKGYEFQHVITPVKNVIYTVRDIGTHLCANGMSSLLLEEIENKLDISGFEPSFSVKRFIEIQKPIDATQIVNNIINFKK